MQRSGAFEPDETLRKMGSPRCKPALPGLAVRVFVVA